ncbi:LysR family transcriptional regulator [Massilia sp. B-10]|nr:LysR family transcriptional regulator [Massilia sp. B-10]
MELRHLRYFIAVAEELHFTRAAERLHIGQPPLSQAIQALEADIGAQLFERTKRSVRLTGAGQLFLADARRILALADEATDTARRAQRGEAGELRIGFTFSTPLTPLFATVINRYRQQYPAVSLKLHEMATLPQLEALAQRSLDLGFVRPPETPPGPGIALDALREDQLVAVLRRLAAGARQPVSIRELEGHAVRDVSARRLSTGIYPQIFRLCRAAGFTPNDRPRGGRSVHHHRPGGGRLRRVGAALGVHPHPHGRRVLPPADRQPAPPPPCCWPGAATTATP